VVVSAEQARAGTVLLTVTALGVVLGLSAAAVLPLLLPWRGAALLTALVVGSSLLPFAALAQAARRRGVPLGSLAWLACAVALLCGLALLPLWNIYRGRVRVLNHGDEPFALWVDGRRAARVEPSSGESALAGVELAVPAGTRDFRLTSELDGRELFRTREHVSGGSPHLFAPLSAGYCFFIERRGYGDARHEPLTSEPLEGATPFWVLPDGIAWFTPNPEPGPFETSGGTLSCLRQRRCTP
jgi:hypothetical protein